MPAGQWGEFRKCHLCAVREVLIVHVLLRKWKSFMEKYEALVWETIMYLPNEILIEVAGTTS